VAGKNRTTATYRPWTVTTFPEGSAITGETYGTAGDEQLVTHRCTPG
jgi:hypothetical protein